MNYDPKTMTIVTKLLASTAGNVPGTLTVPAGKTWILLYARMKLVCDATVANRQLSYSLQTSTEINYRSMYHGANITASQTGYVDYSWTGCVNGLGVVNQGSLDSNVIAQSEMIVKAGDTLNWFVLAGVAGDSLTGRVTVLEIAAK